MGYVIGNLTYIIPFKFHKEKVELVKEIIVNIAQFMAERKEATEDQKYLHLSVERFLQNNQRVLGVSRSSYRWNL
jgi:hypothetical protein